MSPVPENFTVRQTHGPLWQPGVQTRASSDNRGWSSLYASLQRELPFEGTFGAVEDQLVVLHLDGPVMVHRRVAKGEDSRLIPGGGHVHDAGRHGLWCSGERGCSDAPSIP